MSDIPHIIGDTIHFGPWVVGTIHTNIPATVRDRFLKALNGTESLEQYRAGYDAGFSDGYVNGFDEARETNQ